MLAPRGIGGVPLPTIPTISRRRVDDASISGRLRCVPSRFDATDDVADVGVPTRDVPTDAAAAAVPGGRRSMPITVVL